MKFEQALFYFKRRRNKVQLMEEECAIAALEKQIPKKPDLIGDGYDDNGYLIYDTWICPCCRTDYELDYDDYKFCPECGQNLDWNDLKGETK